MKILTTITILAAAILAAAICLVTTGCGSSDADVASKNVSKAAEQFEVYRRIVGINGITDKYLVEVDGFCSVETVDSGLAGALQITCKVGEEKNGDAKVKKTYLGLSDNVSYTVEQRDPIGVSTTHYRLIFKPEVIVPDFDRP